MEKEQYEILYRVEESHWWYLGMQRIVGSLLDRQLVKRNDLRILDAGCGTGGMVKYLRRFGHVVGIDVADEALRRCRWRGLRHLARASIEGLPFADESFDLLTSFDVLYHRAVVNDRRALAEFHRVLKPGGTILLRVPAYDWLRGGHDVAVHTRHRYSRGELIRKLHAAGFRVRRTTYANSLLFPVAALKRLLEGGHAPSRGDLGLPSPLVNRVLLGVLSLEAALLPAVSLPWGLSVMAVAEKVVSDRPTAGR
ncbi:MAG: class I SAM-dependent methyltransferase [Sphingomonadaceae bacterium]